LSKRLTLFVITAIVQAIFFFVCNEAVAADLGGGGNNGIFSSQVSADSEQPQKYILSSFLSKFNVTGYLKNETAYRFDEPRSITKIRNIAYINANRFFGSSVKFTFSAWAYYDLAYDLFNYDTISGRAVRESNQPLVFVENLANKKDSPVAEVRELYLDLFLENTDIRIGKQFVVWGVLEGVRVTDEINPIDFRELILLDLLDYRIPLWTFKLDHYAPIGKFEFLWIPEVRHNEPAPPGSEWELLQTVPNTRAPPEFGLRVSEVGFKYTTEIGDAELALSYFYTWDDFPTIFRNVRLNSAQDPVFFPTYTRITMYGATIVKPLGITIIKGELAYVPDKYFGIHSVDQNGDGFLDNNGAVQKRHLRWGLGVDVNYWGIDFSPAVVQWIIFNYDNSLIQDQYDTSFNLYVRKVFPEQSAVFSMLLIRLINLNEMFLAPKVTFNVTDHFDIAVGLDLFYGKISRFGPESVGGGVANLNNVVEDAQFFGNFHNNDRVFTEFKYTF